MHSSRLATVLPALPVEVEDVDAQEDEVFKLAGGPGQGFLQTIRIPGSALECDGERSNSAEITSRMERNTGLVERWTGGVSFLHLEMNVFNSYIVITQKTAM